MSADQLKFREFIIKQSIKYLSSRGVEVTFKEFDDNIPKKLPKKKKRKFSYKIFVKICEEQGMDYFLFNDENNWSGPATKVETSSLEEIISLFKKKNIHIVESGNNDFVYIRPLKCEIDFTSYPKKTVYDESTDDEDDEWIKWKYDGVDYWVDKKDNIYCLQTEVRVGKKIDDYSAEFY